MVYEKLLKRIDKLSDDSRISVGFLDDENVSAIPYVVIGDGDEVLVSTYGIHGNEEASARSFADTPNEVLKSDIDLSKVKYVGILMNPIGVRNESRMVYTHNGSFDLNRDWVKFTHVYTRMVKEFLDSLDISVHIGHHDFYGKSKNLFYVSTKLRNGHSHIAPKTDSFVQAILREFDRQNMPYKNGKYGKFPSNLDAGPYKWFNGDSALEDYLTKREVVSFGFEGAVHRPIPLPSLFRVVIPYSKLSIERRVSFHTAADMAVLRKLDKKELIKFYNEPVAGYTFAPAIQ